jgi:hypothetical protein
MRRRTAMSVCTLALVVATGWSVRTPAYAAELKKGSLTGGASVGFLENTPDGSAFAINLNGDAFIERNLSLGPLVQLGFTGDMAQIGVSGQVKYWLAIPNTPKPLRLAFQGGLGFVHSDFRESDTSWLIPLGAGADYALSPTLAITGTLLLNLTNLDTGPGGRTKFMPGFSVGLRF